MHLYRNIIYSLCCSTILVFSLSLHFFAYFPWNTNTNLVLDVVKPLLNTTHPYFFNACYILDHDAKASSVIPNIVRFWKRSLNQLLMCVLRVLQAGTHHHVQTLCRNGLQLKYVKWHSGKTHFIQYKSTLKAQSRNTKFPITWLVLEVKPFTQLLQRLSSCP